MTYAFMLGEQARCVALLQPLSLYSSPVSWIAHSSDIRGSAAKAEVAQRNVLLRQVSRGADVWQPALSSATHTLPADSRLSGSNAVSMRFVVKAATFEHWEQCLSGYLERPVM